jgi:leader peptidase (prepilin peptidase)/N-methyltransferase
VDGLAIILSGLVGLVVGSFLNVVILRLPRRESVVTPPSHCPSCGTPLRWYHNIPLVSWVALRGRCAFCRSPIGWQYPLVEAATAAIWAGNVAAYGITPESARAIVFLTLLLAIAVTDARFYVIPDELSLGGAILGTVLAALPGGPTVPEAVIGAVIGGAALWLVAILGTWAFRKEAMGGGDIKMLTMIGAFLGWKGALLSVFIGALAGSIVFVPIAWRSDRLVPFGLFLALGAALTLYLGAPLLQWYLGFLR